MNIFSKIAAAALLAIALAAPAAAQQLTAVTGTITDPNGLPYSGATLQAVLIYPGGGGSPRLTPCTNNISGCPIQQQSPAVTLSPTGAFLLSLWANGSILPALSTYTFVISTAGVAPPFGTGPQSFQVTGVTISGASQNVSATLSAAAPAQTAAFGPGLSGTVQAGAQYLIPFYPNGGSATVVGPSNISTDSTKNNLNVPGTLTVTGPANANDLAAGNVANKPAVSDAILYVSKNGSDTNDGLSWGSAKATISGAQTALPVSGGTIYVGFGVFPIASTLLIGSDTQPVTVVLVGSTLNCTMTTGTDCIDLGNEGHLWGSGNAANGISGYGSLIISAATASVTSLITNDHHSGATGDVHFDLENISIVPNQSSTFADGVLWLFGVDGNGTIRQVEISAAPTTLVLLQSGAASPFFLNNILLDHVFAACGGLSTCTPEQILDGGVTVAGIAHTAGAFVDTANSTQAVNINGQGHTGLAGVSYQATYFESFTGETGNFINVADASAVSLEDVTFGGGPALSACLKISDTATTTGVIHIHGREIGSVCTNDVNNTKSGATIGNLSSFAYDYVGSNASKNTIDGPVAMPNLPSSGTVANSICSDSSGNLLAIAAGNCFPPTTSALVSGAITATSISNSSPATQLAQIMVAQPASGCAWRIGWSYSFEIGATATMPDVAFAIWDGTAAYQPAFETAPSNGNGTSPAGRTSVSASGKSNVQYPTGTSSVTLTLYAQGTSGGGTASSFAATNITLGSPISNPVSFAFQGYGVCMN